MLKHLCNCFLFIGTVNAQDVAMVILIERGGGYNFAALATAKAVSMVTFVAVTCTLAHDSFVTHNANLGKFLDMAFLTERLVIVGDEGHPC